MVAFFVGAAGDGGADGDPDGGSGSARRPLREARSSPPRLAAALELAAALGASAEAGRGVSVGGPRVIAAVAAPTTTPASAKAAIRGTERRGTDRAVRMSMFVQPRR